MPELAIKRFGGELFYLVKTYSANPVITQEGEEIPIHSTFTLPKGQSEYRFKLQQGDAGEALTYEAVVRHRVFPTEHDIPCRLRMLYHYGSDNPYTLYFEPTDPESAGFSSVLVDWQKEQIQSDNLPYPHFPPSLSWKSLGAYPRKGKEDSLFDWATDYFNHVLGKIENLSKCEQSIVEVLKARIVIDHGHKRMFLMREKSFCGGIRITDKLRTVAMIYHKGKDEVSCANGLEWILNRNNGSYFAKYIDDSGREIRFHKSDFISEAEYNQKPYTLYYTLGRQSNNGWYHANFIRTNDFPVYIVDKVCEQDDESAFRDRQHVLFPLHRIFSDGRTLASPKCPASFKDCVVHAIPRLVKMFQDTKDDSVRKNLIKILSLITCPEYPDFYAEANKLLDNNTNDIPYELGILLGDGTSKEQKEILQRICALKNKSMTVCMLSRALWKNPRLVYNIPRETLTGYLGVALKFRQLPAFEYVLAVLRLRSLDDKELNLKLSMNNRVMAKLCAEVEKRIKAVKDNPSLESKYNSRMTFDDKTIKAAKDKNIPVFLYALLSYITGEKGENEIKITEIKEEE